jgi:hypothetical protein
MVSVNDEQERMCSEKSWLIISYNRSEVTSAWSYTSTSPYVCMVWCLVKYQEQLHL